MKQGKVWGMTELICANHALEFHRIDFKKGGVFQAQAQVQVEWISMLSLANF